MSHDLSPDPSSTPGSVPGAAFADQRDGPDSAATPVVTATLSIAGFIDGWIHCQHVADYLARFAASDRFDPAQLTTRLSTYLNEALELVFRSQPIPPAPGAPGEIVVAIHRLPDRLQVELRCPAGPAADLDSHADPSGAPAGPGVTRLRRGMRRAAEPDAAAAYRRDFSQLLRDTATDTREGTDEGTRESGADAGLLELVALHGIGLELSEGSDAVVLRLIVPHE
ncbi:MAG: hypothetical protein IPO88_18440 [Nannocystis sp.]|uniref:hypothetical protein n=1 Tax=Nannocystis sp. TaxID=1962667 RepID=UPI002420AB0F|nr:hypothetical protein [Nannocystis sp.]MBK9755446.1 hypothetical protein [Nannocystis sp.]